MASPGDKKGRRRGSCGHIMASFDNHEKCARCREKWIRKITVFWISPVQYVIVLLSRTRKCFQPPTYRICKVKKTGLLVSRADVTVIALVEDREPAFRSPPHSSVQASTHAQPEASTSSFVTPVKRNI